MKLSRVLASAALVLTAASCRHHAESDTGPAQDPTAGRDQITVFYSSNQWGELLECG